MAKCGYSNLEERENAQKPGDRLCQGRQVNLLSTEGLREEDEIPTLDANESGSRGFDIRDEQKEYRHE
jgi:hypothetical protein